MRVPLAACLAVLCFESGARADTLHVVLDAGDGPIPSTTAASVVWHAVRAKLGHDVVVTDADEILDLPADAALVAMRLNWAPMAVSLDRAVSASPSAPTLEVTRFAVRDGVQEPHVTWVTKGDPAVFRLADEGTWQFLSLPEVALQEAVWTALDGVPVASEGANDASELGPAVLDLVVSADDGFRSVHGDGWRLAVDERVAEANALLASANIALRVREVQPWYDDTAGELGGVLEKFAADETAPDGVIRLGIVGPNGHGGQSSAEDVGRAFVPGRVAVVVDQDAPPGSRPVWDRIDEGTVIAHEVLHALGVPHEEQAHCLMSEEKHAVVHTMSDRSRQLARTAALVRSGRLDVVASLRALSKVAAEHLGHDPQLQVDYVVDNIRFGPGLPDPGTVPADAVPALAHAALARHYFLRFSESGRREAGLRGGALQHSRAALAADPAAPVVHEVLSRLRDVPDVPELGLFELR